MVDVSVLEMAKTWKIWKLRLIKMHWGMYIVLLGCTLIRVLDLGIFYLWNTKKAPHPVKEVSMSRTSPLILVQFLKNSMFEALTPIVLVRRPTPIPSQAVRKRRKIQSGCLKYSCLSLNYSLLNSTFGTGSVADFAALDSTFLHLIGARTAGANTGSTCHHVVIYSKRNKPASNTKDGAFCFHIFLEINMKVPMLGVQQRLAKLQNLVLIWYHMNIRPEWTISILILFM